MKELELDVTGMMCTGCENRIKNALSEIKGIESVEANHETGKVQADDVTGRGALKFPVLIDFCALSGYSKSVCVCILLTETLRRKFYDRF